MESQADQAVAAVLTGDLVKSSRLSAEERRRLLRQLEAMPEAIGDRFGIAGEFLVDVYRGDSWQMYLAEPQLALRVALYARARIRSVPGARQLDTRIGLGFGTAKFGGERQLSDADGTAFRLAGQAAEAVAGQASMAARFPPEVSRLYGQGFNTVLRLLDIPAVNWTAKQAHALSQALLERTQTEIGAMWPSRSISQQAVAQHLERAGWSRIEFALAYAESTLAHALAPVTAGQREDGGSMTAHATND